MMYACWYDVHVHQLLLIKISWVWTDLVKIWSNYIQIQFWPPSLSLSLSLLSLSIYTHKNMCIIILRYMILSDGIVNMILIDFICTVHSHNVFSRSHHVSSPLLNQGSVAAWGVVHPNIVGPARQWGHHWHLGGLKGGRESWNLEPVLPICQIRITSWEWVAVYIFMGNIYSIEDFPMF